MQFQRVLSAVTDRNVKDWYGFAEELLGHWQYDLCSRKPGPALLENGLLEPTDLDLACFLSALAERNAVINIPHYIAKRATVTKSNEKITSKTNRHGKVMGLVANQDVFSFGMRIIDENVEVGGKAGAFRTFMLIDFDGQFYPGWERIEFHPTARENDFLNDRRLWTENTIYFKNFVHPNRWSALFGNYYLLTKVVIQRLEEEASHHRREAKRLHMHLSLPPSAAEVLESRPETETAQSQAKIVTAWEFQVDVPFSGEYSLYQVSQTNIDIAKNLAKELARLKAALSFATRSVELAYVRADPTKVAPKWAKTASRKWEDFKPPKARTIWKRMILDLAGTELGLRMRSYERTERVAI